MELERIRLGTVSVGEDEKVIRQKLVADIFNKDSFPFSQEMKKLIRNSKEDFKGKGPFGLNDAELSDFELLVIQMHRMVSYFELELQKGDAKGLFKKKFAIEGEKNIQRETLRLMKLVTAEMDKANLGMYQQILKETG